MSVATIRSACKTLLAATSGVGKVNDTIPYGDTAGFFADYYKQDASGKVNGWVITVQEVAGDQHVGHLDRTYTITFRGWIEIDHANESRKAAENVIEALVTKFAGTDANRRLGSTVDWTDPPTTAIEDISVRAGAGLVACHQITITLTAYVETALA